jgi:LPS sulfotransferase NodH
MTCYAICTTPRTGGNFLDRLLAEAGIGQPGEYFHPQRVGGIDKPKEIWKANTHDGILGIRFHWEHRETSYLVPDLDWAFPVNAKEVRWILLSRGNTKDQAKSWLTALETGKWEDSERGKYKKFSQFWVRTMQARIRRQNADWIAWFMQKNLAWQPMRYEMMVKDPEWAVEVLRKWIIDKKYTNIADG